VASKVVHELPVNRCACIEKTFKDLKAYSSLEKAMQATEAGTRCSGCLPYLKLVFSTGETAFAIEDPRLEDELPLL